MDRGVDHASWCKNTISFRFKLKTGSYLKIKENEIEFSYQRLTCTNYWYTRHLIRTTGLLSGYDVLLLCSIQRYMT